MSHEVWKDNADVAPEVLHVITGLLTGGAERSLARLVQAMLGLGIKSTVLAVRDGPVRAELERAGVRTAALSTGGVRHWTSMVVVTRRAARCARARLLINGWMYHGNLIALVLGRVLGAYVVWSVRQGVAGGQFDSRRTRAVIWVTARLSRFADAVVFNSERSYTEHVAIGFSLANSVVIGNGFDVPAKIDIETARHQARQQLGIPEAAFVVAHIARAHPVKNHPMFLQACKIVAATRRSAHFVVIGKDVEGSHREDVLALRIAAGQERVHVIGECNDPDRLLCGADLLCLTSWSESFPNVIGEAMARGVPCVTTPVGDVARLVSGCGTLVPFGDVTALARAIEGWIDMNVLSRRALGSIARDRVVSEWSIETAAVRYQELYLNCTRGRVASHVQDRQR